MMSNFELSTDYFSNSNGSSVTNSQLSPFIASAGTLMRQGRKGRETCEGPTK
jgi:hypothetical protein